MARIEIRIYDKAEDTYPIVEFAENFVLKGREGEAGVAARGIVFLMQRYKDDFVRLANPIYSWLKSWDLFKKEAK